MNCQTHKEHTVLCGNVFSDHSHALPLVDLVHVLGTRADLHDPWHTIQDRSTSMHTPYASTRAR